MIRELPGKGTVSSDNTAADSQCMFVSIVFGKVSVQFRV